MDRFVNSPQENPWKTVSPKEIYSNSWIRVWEDEVLNPRGGKGIYGRVNFKNKAIGVIPLDEDRNTWLVGQYRYTLNQYSWEIPMGGGPIEEDILISAQRELKEETGLEAEKWTLIQRIHTSNSVTDEEGFVFWAQDLIQGEPSLEETEELVVRKLRFEEVLRMVMDGEITDSISVAGILKTARLLKNP